MSSFEFVFSFFGLLLGLTLVEILNGLVRTVKASGPRARAGGDPVRLGWLTPLLGLFALLDIASYWVNVWGIRDMLPVGFDSVFGMLIIASIYYFAASLVFPDDARKWPDLDAWFWLHRRQVLLCIGVVNLFWVSFYSALGDNPGFFITALFQAIYFFPLLMAASLRNRFAVGGALAFLCLGYLAQAGLHLRAHLT